MCSGVELDIRKCLIQQFYFWVTWFDCLVEGHRMASLISQLVNHLPAMKETQVRFPSREDPLEKGMASTPVFLPGEPMDRGAWRATVHGIARVRPDLVTAAKLLSHFSRV